MLHVARGSQKSTCTSETKAKQSKTIQNKKPNTKDKRDRKRQRQWKREENV